MTSVNKSVIPIACLCGRVSQKVQLSPSASSVLNLCHCNSCREITGLLCSSYHPLQDLPTAISSLQGYQQTEDITRYFCPTCGAHCFLHLKHLGKYLVASGLLETELQHPVKDICHWGVADTSDGGLSLFLPGARIPSGSRCRFFCSQSPDMEEQPIFEDAHCLQARCHCGGIHFTVTKPNSMSLEPSSPWPDLLVPYHSASSENKNDVKWWLRNRNSKYLAGTCACPSCRLGSGFPIQTWAFIPKSNILGTNGSTLTFDMPTMQRYESSPRVYREFCSRCGATAFWHCEERPRIIDVSVGLLRASSGPLAGEWLDWVHDRVSFSEMAMDKAFIGLLASGLQNWGVEEAGSH